MRFINAILSVVALGAVSTFALPGLTTPAPKLDLVKRCDSCDGPGYGIGNGISTVADVDVALRTFTDLHFVYTGAVAKVFANVNTNVAVTVKSVLAVGVNILTWAPADVTALAVALDGFVAGTVTAGAEIFIKAGIDAASWTVIEAGCLKTLITTCISANIIVAIDVQADLLVFVSNSLCAAQCTVVKLQTKVHTCQTSLASVVASLHLDVKVATCVSAATSIKLALQAYVKACINGTTQTGGFLASLLKTTLSKTLSIALSTLLAFIDAWVSGNCDSLSGSILALLGINLSVASDFSICKTIVAYLLNCGANFNFCSSLGLDASLYLGVFSAVSIQ